MSDGLKMVLSRNAFYRDNFRRALIILILLICANGLLAGLIYYKYTHPAQPQYFATTDDGRMINWHPLNDPVVPDNFVLQWAANATRQAFSMDFLHWRSQLQAASINFTPFGWNYFVQSLKQSNNLKTIINLKMVSNVEITGAPQVLEKAIVDGRYVWKIQLPIDVVFENSEKSINMPMIVTLIVERVPVTENSARIAINNFLPVVQQSEVSTSY